VLDHPVFQTKPTLAQFAKNGSWETAWAFSLETTPTINAVTEFLEHTNEVAFELQEHLIHQALEFVKR
jgi:hypothetical protein